MNSKTTRSMPQLKVVPHRPWRRWAWVFLALLVSAGSVVGGFVLGQDDFLRSRTELNQLRDELAVTQQQLDGVSEELIDAQLVAEVQGEAASALRDDLTALHKDNDSLAEELTFYKSLMAPSSLANGLQIAELVVEPEGKENFRYELLLTQVALRRSYIKGTVRVDVVGASASDDEAVLSLTELADLDAYPLKFKFRYFQDLSGQMALPTGFRPQRVLVTATQAGKAPVQQSFPWPDTANVSFTSVTTN